MERMIQAGVEPSNITWGIVINGFVRANQLEIAETVLQNCIDESLSLQDTQQRRLLQDTKVHVDYDKALPQTIEDVLDKASLRNYHLKHNLSSYLFTPIVDAYKNIGDFNEAKQTVNNMLRLSVPMTVPVYVSLMTIFLNEDNHDAVETMWQGLYQRKSSPSILEHLDPIFEEPIPVPNVEYNYTNLLTLDEEDSAEENKTATSKQ
ncbi:hypothetical protein ABG067_008339, partial [Albugo candida]